MNWQSLGESVSLHVFVYWSLHAIVKYSIFLSFLKKLAIRCEKKKLRFRVRALNLTVPLGSGRVGSDDLGYGPGSGFSLKPVQTSTPDPSCSSSAAAPRSEDELFPLSLVPSLQRLPPQMKEFVKFQIHKLIYESSTVLLNLERLEPSE